MNIKIKSSNISRQFLSVLRIIDFEDICFDLNLLFDSAIIFIDEKDGIY